MTNLANQAFELINILYRFNKTNLSNIQQAADLIIDAFKNNHKLLVCGNGGSAAESDHLVTELVVKFRNKRIALPAISFLNPSVITATGNDFDFSEIFARQIEAFGQPGDVLLVMSTSGKSENINHAVQIAKDKKIKVIYLTGQNMPEGVKPDIVITVPSINTPRIQEVHLFIIHLLAEIIESDFGYPKWEKENI